jgi:hypothetical protein
MAGAPHPLKRHAHRLCTCQAARQALQWRARDPPACARTALQARSARADVVCSRPSRRARRPHRRAPDPQAAPRARSGRADIVCQQAVQARAPVRAGGVPLAQDAAHVRRAHDGHLARQPRPAFSFSTGSTASPAANGLQDLNRVWQDHNLTATLTHRSVHPPSWNCCCITSCVTW